MRHTISKARAACLMTAALFSTTGLLACDQPPPQPASQSADPAPEHPKSRAGQVIKDARDAKKQAESRGRQINDDLNSVK